MSDDDVKAIAAALETPDADLLRLRIGWHGEKWLRALLAERERLQTVVEACRKVVYEAENNHHLATNWATSQIADALAALDAGQEAG